MAGTVGRPAASDGSYVWADPAEEAVYGRTVEACLGDPRVVRKLDTRPGVTAGAVRAAMAQESNTARALAPCAGTHAAYRAAADKLTTTRAALARTRAAVDIDARVVALWLIVVLLLTGIVFGGVNVIQRDWGVAAVAAVSNGLLTVAIAWIVITGLSSQDIDDQLTLLESALTVKPYAVTARVELRRWENDLRQNGTAPAVLAVIEALLGDDPHSVLLPDSYEGLRAARGGDYLVAGSAARDLERKMAILEGGTIAVCGPRGSGKTTLLENAAGEGDFSVSAHVPASYTPHDFLLSLFTDVCERFIRREGHTPPEFTRLSGAVRGMRALRKGLRVLRRRLFFAAVAASLVVLGSYAAARSLWTGYDEAVRARTDAAGEWSTGLVADVWQGRDLGAGLLITLAGLFVWQVRRSASWRRRLRMLPGLLLRAAALGLVVAAVVSAFLDTELQRLTRELGGEGPFVAVEAGLLCGFLGLLLAGYVQDTLRLGGRSFPARWVFSPAALLCLAAFVELFRRNDVAVAMFLDRDNPTRLLCLVVAALLQRIASRRPRLPEPPLVTRCRDQLYHLKTVQLTSATVSPTAAQLATLAGTYTSSLTTIPPNFPALVRDFRDILTRIAKQVRQGGHRTVLALDELDRLGSDTQARAFLGEIKAILGVPHVYYLISVSDDVGAAFVRRGLPHRDTTDSSLDDIVHVQPCGLEESQAIMERRAPGLTGPYVTLTHALSGGIPRDLIRYGRRIMEMHERTGSLELTDISRRLVLEELTDTLAGYRTLLSKQQWSSENASVLTSYRELMAQLRSACVCRTDSVTLALGRFSAQSAPGAAPAASALPEDAVQLTHEASVYAYFALTLLQVFSSPGYDQRSARAAAYGPAGDARCLAEARLELVVSTYSARSLIDDVRQAWDLPAVTSRGLAAVVPAARGGVCPLHPAG
ncbi:hypothetical protein [Streptomyces sp. NPDC049881]|uniref:hypothetical protein n=1 Tax=Streptomyces sp. NPDC049881 TaxID=3155778 RepID=UPI00342EAB0B